MSNGFSLTGVLKVSTAEGVMDDSEMAEAEGRQVQWFAKVIMLYDLFFHSITIHVSASY